MKTVSKDIKQLIQLGKDLGQKVKEENFALNIPLVVGENGEVIEIYRDGSKKILSTKSTKNRCL